MITKKITTKLKNKEDHFRVCALGEALALPILFIGPSGTGKSEIIEDYTTAPIVDENGNEINADTINDIFKIQLNIDTRVKELLGSVDEKELIENGKYVRNTKICDATTVFVDEIDKAVSGVRSSLLSLLNEKAIPIGNETIRANWKLFVGSCNEINNSRIEIPFWDRFIIKSKVDRIGETRMIDYIKQGGHRKVRYNFDIRIPTMEEIDQRISEQVFEYDVDKFISICYEHLSDRNCVKLVDLVAAVSLIWDITVKSAYTVVAALLINEKVAAKVANQIVDVQKDEITRLISMLKLSSTEESTDKILDQITAAINKGLVNKDISPTLAKELTEQAIKVSTEVKRSQQDPHF